MLRSRYQEAVLSLNGLSSFAKPALPAVLYEVSLARLQSLGQGTREDIEKQIEVKRIAHFIVKGVRDHFDAYRQAKRNAEVYKSRPEDVLNMETIGDLSVEDNAAIKHEFKGEENLNIVQAPLNENTGIKGVPFCLTTRGTVLYRMDADMVEKDPQKRDVIEVPIGRLLEFARPKQGNLEDILMQIKYRSHANFDIPVLDNLAVENLKAGGQGASNTTRPAPAPSRASEVIAPGKRGRG